MTTTEGTSMTTKTAATIRPGDVVVDTDGSTATVTAGPTRSSRAAGRVNFLAVRPDGRGVSFTVADTDRLAVQ
jgi:hypothetical protein